MKTISRCRNNNIPQLKGFIFSLDNNKLYMQKDGQSICIATEQSSKEMFCWLNLFNPNLKGRNWTRKCFKDNFYFIQNLKYGLSFF